MKGYSYDEALSASLDYFNGEELPARVFVDKYALRNKDNELLEKTPDDMHRRLASEFARIESTKFKDPLSFETIYSYFKNYSKIIPQGSPIFGIGNKEQNVSLSNCFVVPSPADSYGGIMQTDQHIVQISKRRGGIGYDISELRPADVIVSNAAKTTSGAVSFMHRFSSTCREVCQDGRRGAMMISMSVHHPQVEDFATIKNDDKSVTGANISLRLSDEFLQALEDGKTYEQRWPIEKEGYDNPLLDMSRTDRTTKRKKIKIKPSFQRMVDAKQVWKTIVHSAWLRAEPGILFWDNILRESPADCYAEFGFKTVSTNPCIVGETLIAVADGRNAVSIKQLAEEGKDVPVYSVDIKTGQRQIKIGRNPRKTKSRVEVWKLKLDDGSILIATPDHKILKKDLTYCNLKDLKNGESLYPFNSFDNNGYRQITSTGQKMVGGAIRNRRQYRLIHEFESNTIIDAKKFAIHHKDFDSYNDDYNNLQVLTHEEHNRLHADKMMGLANPYHKQNKEWKFKFASHPGSANAKWIDVSNQELVKHGEELFNFHGKLTKKIWIKYAKANKLPQILSNKARFGSFANFKNQVASNHKVISVEFYGYEDVYNITVDDNNNYDIITTNSDNKYIVSSGITIKNCGEIPLSAYDSCRLMAINLLHCVKNAFTKDAYFDFKELYTTAQITQRLMDDLVDLELEAIDKLIAKVKADPEPDSIKRTELELWENVKKSCINGRRTGTGITGLGDVMAALGIKYGSDQSINTTSQIYQTLKFGSYRSSVDMAKELGPFPIWNWELEKNNPFIKRIKDEVLLLSDVRENNDYFEFKDVSRLDERFEKLVRHGKDLYNDIKKYGRRNIANLTSAPTGTISTQASIEVLNKLFFNISSGIEPVWSYEYTRRKKVCPGDEGVRVDFIDDTGDNWMEFPVYHSGVSAWMYANGTDKPDGNPYEGSTANDIDWVQRVKLQAAAQKHVDHSISSTVNLPKDVKEEEVAKIYEAAWKAGCKGITVYRDGCRSGVLVDKSKEQAIISTERPKDLPCDVHHITVKGKQYFVLVGLDSNGKPYEVFSGKNGFIDKDIKTGVISRKKKGLYKVVFEDGSELSPITAACDEQEETITRLTSALLRTGADMHLVVEQLEKVNGEMSGFAKSLSRAVKKYIPDGTEVKGEECPECKSTEIIRQEGCKTCRKCGWSKCS